MTAPHHQHGLGRKVAVDPRDRNYLLTQAALPPADRSRTWPALPPLDQGNTPQCTAYSTATAIMAAPYEHRDLLKRVDLSALYHEAQTLDEFPGTDYDGTTVRAACKVWQAHGFVSQYRWCDSIDMVLSALVNLGPVVIGSSWLESMFTPDSTGTIHATGSVAGGHAYALIGFDLKRQRVRILNSWGNWGQNGRAWLSVDDLATLYADQGEAAVLVDPAAKEFNAAHPIMG